jgi:hypothetical protein
MTTPYSEAASDLANSRNRRSQQVIRPNRTPSWSNTTGGGDGARLDECRLPKALHVEMVDFPIESQSAAVGRPSHQGVGLFCIR